MDLLAALGKRIIGIHPKGFAPPRPDDDQASIAKKEDINPYLSQQVFSTHLILRSIMRNMKTSDIARLAPLNGSWLNVATPILDPLRASKLRLSFRVTDPCAIRMWRDESFPLGILLQAVERWRNEDGIWVYKYRIAKGQPTPLQRASLRGGRAVTSNLLPIGTHNTSHTNTRNTAPTGFVGPPWSEVVFTGPTATFVRPLLALFPSDLTVYGPLPAVGNLSTPDRPAVSKRVSFQVYGQDYFIRIKYGPNDTWDIAALYITETLQHPLIFGAPTGARDIEWIFPAARRQILRKAVLNVCPPGRGKPLIQLIDDGLDVLLSTAQSGYTYKGHLRYLFGARPEQWLSDLLSALLRDDGYPWSHSVSMYHDCDATVRDLMSKLENRLTTIRAWTALPEEKRREMIDKNRTRTAEAWASGVLSSIILELRGVKPRGRKGSREWVDEIVRELKRWDAEKSRDPAIRKLAMEEDFGIWP
ncbi:hypothetical protein SeMB42_g03479 [Synchytrium endobioticum]|uniref:F-box domain-containing protein n=1 Tax=Synchytrium endobioticum TaxID=286115 RepID=A0A507D6W0_9FUNG|nr:hypothetical protein SeMB42_g03479 [Synchytrium endobioticum]TPX50287.1 hypothetical protein SeLEV6574_g00987 [Synchytrium endobioticum]